MTKTPAKPVQGTPTEALKSNPRKNEREAEELYDAPHRREQEEANRNKERARSRDGSGDGKVMRDIATDLPPD